MKLCHACEGSGMVPADICEGETLYRMCAACEGYGFEGMEILKPLDVLVRKYSGSAQCAPAVMSELVDAIADVRRALRRVLFGV